MCIKVMIVDDHPIMAAGLRNVMEGCAGISVLGCYHSYDELLCGISKQCPDIVLESCRHGAASDHLALRINKEYPAVRILALVSAEMGPSFRAITKVQRAGYLMANASLQRLLEVIRTIYDGEEYQDEVFSDSLQFKGVRKVGRERLTKREREILKLVIGGYTNMQISEKLFLSVRTVENHRNNILQKMNVRNTASLIKTAIELGLA